MKIIMSVSILLMIVVVGLVGCTVSFGEKVAINKKSEIYIKDGATKEEAQKLGQFLLENNYFDTITPRSIQLLHNNDTLVVKFVVNKEKIQNDEQAIIGFRYFQTLIRDSVFMGKPTTVLLTDGGFKELRRIKEFTKEELDSAADNSEDSSDMEPAAIDTIKQ